MNLVSICPRHPDTPGILQKIIRKSDHQIMHSIAECRLTLTCRSLSARLSGSGYRLRTGLMSLLAPPCNPRDPFGKSYYLCFDHRFTGCSPCLQTGRLFSFPEIPFAADVAPIHRLTLMNVYAIVKVQGVSALFTGRYMYSVTEQKKEMVTLSLHCVNCE